MERIISLLPREVDEGAFLRRRRLHRVSRIVARLYLTGRLTRDESFDSYPELGIAMCRKITADLNSILRNGGLAAVIEYTPQNLNYRVQTLTHQAYLRVINPTAQLPNTEAIIDGPIISTRLTRSQENTERGAVDFDVRTNYGHNRAFLLSGQKSRDGFAIIVGQPGNTYLLLDKSPHPYSRSPEWRINSRFFA